MRTRGGPHPPGKLFILCLITNNTYVTQFTFCFVDNISSQKRNLFWPLLQRWIRRGRREQAQATPHAQAQNGGSE